MDFERGILSGLLLGLDNILPMKRGFALGVRDWGEGGVRVGLGLGLGSQ